MNSNRERTEAIETGPATHYGRVTVDGDGDGVTIELRCPIKACDALRFIAHLRAFDATVQQPEQAADAAE